MKFAEVAENVKQLAENPPPRDEFIAALLLAYGTPKATIARLKAGQLNLSAGLNDVLLKKKVWFKKVEQASRLPNQDKLSDNKQAGRSLYVEIEEMKTAKAAKTNDPRFLIVTDFKQLLAVDRKTGDTLDIKVRELETHFTFFLPWAGMEKTKLSNENPADVKAAEKMAKLFDAIKQDNPDYMRHDAHAMNVFLARLLFCLFAEDTGIFQENAVSNAIASHTAEDGSDLDAFFKQLFDWLDTSDECRPPKAEAGAIATATKQREVAISNTELRISKDEGPTEYTEHTEGKIGHEGARKGTKTTAEESLSSMRSFVANFSSLSYVNGGLFRDHYDIPQFSAKSRRMLIESGTLTWAEINPDIFGSMFQAVIDPEERHNLGQHYTSVTNIMKVIEPLFLNDFKEELERARNLSQKNVRIKALNDLHDRIAKVKIFDPACGSGNFLIIAYKELRKLEMELFEAMNAFPVSRITVDQFYGIEIADFACETATLSLWLAEHQMNLEYQKRFKQSLTSLPLKDGAHIVCGNACRKNWEEVCPKNDGDEIYILGNPPYLGSSMQNKEQKQDLELLCTGFQNYKNLDYIACWFLRAADYIGNANVKSAFVSTNSITQGEQVGLLWPHIFSKGLELGFAHQSFKWANHAKGNAGVTCVIIGLRNKSADKCRLFKGGIVQTVDSIGPYLTSGAPIIIARRSSPISNIPKMLKGSFATDGGALFLTETEKKNLEQLHPDCSALVRQAMGSSEFINSEKRWCLWIKDDRTEIAQQSEFIQKRLEAVCAFRLDSKADCSQNYAKYPHRFKQITHREAPSIIIPRVSSERRLYIPMGFLPQGIIVLDSAQVIYNAKVHIFGILSSLMHMTWVRATAGQLESRIRYSSAVCYNNFPIPDLTEEQKQTITMHVGNVLEEREKHPEKTMAQLYDPDKMPAGLREAHHQLDLAVDRIYRSKPFASDEERLEHLFKLYEEMTAREKLI
jgi:hypothetical protein